ncbi:MAG: hypothetical protein JXA06_10610 [Bacteroidetes bacterium]|nr:hypothetical protein [Bacteroidota bacterium]
MAHKQGINRNQSVLFPKVMDDYISNENPVRFIDAYVDTLSAWERTLCPAGSRSLQIELH